jgi:hypothetical protein
MYLDTSTLAKSIMDRREYFKSKKSFYREDTVSRAKRTPATGALKAPAIPAPAPQVTRSLRSLSFLKYLSHLDVIRYLREPPCPRIDAMHAPVCTRGPAFPTCSDADTAAMHPTTCSNQKIRNSGILIEEEQAATI